MTAQIALLLHMHQPDYRDPASGEPIMPWVRLHAVRGYTDAVVLAVEEGARPTLNVVPSLLDQLERYAAGGTDPWARISRIPAEHLDGVQRAFINQRFVHGHPTMRRGSSRYRALEAMAAAGAVDDAQDLRDLQVWSNLAWMGVVARRDPFVAGLMRQDRGFSHPQLEHLMSVQDAMVRAVLPLWRSYAHVSCTPYTHPILPLLVNFDHAQRCLPAPPDPVAFAHPADAARQIREGLDRSAEVLGRRPAGMWPSEGSVSPEVAAIAAAEGVRWLATDQGVLERSLRDGPPDLRRAWRVEDTDLHIIFRDRSLSDRVGFQYASWQGEAAAADLLSSVRGEGVHPVMLDGENPWESYPDAGEAFLRALYRSGRVIGVDEALPVMPVGHIRRLHTGSWINADFAIWAGDPMDRAAWRRLAALRSAYEEQGRPAAAWPHLRAAEGSDWFWWYGPEHHSDMRDLFDLLFRRHLAAGWAALGRPAPADLAHPVWTDLIDGAQPR
ncbi:MAG: hypothetical protein JNM72_18330 [Deltaproteobacteria bacterium]|nr:hypothetical protein [Deltaproteobacteria bacterium]